MKANEFQIGDYVWIGDDTYVKVESITKRKIGYHLAPKECKMHYSRICEIGPATITSEILEKNRFIKYEHPGYPMHYTYELPCDGSVFRLFALYDSDFSFNINSQAMNIKYVHELQHALKLCGIKKEIEL